jgi:hypothetical protein
VSAMLEATSLMRVVFSLTMLGASNWGGGRGAWALDQRWRDMFALPGRLFWVG